MSKELRKYDIIALAAALALAALPLESKALTVELINNGSFESGDFTGWTRFNQAGGSGDFFTDDSLGGTPLSSRATVGPASGSFYAVSDQTGPGAHALLQKFTLPSTAISQAILSWDMFVNDWSGLGPIVSLQGLDYTANPNQHARVDLLTEAIADGDPLSTAVLQNFYLSVDPAETRPNTYTRYSFDILPYTTPGGTYAIRFAEVDNQSFLNLGVDNVSLQVSSPSSAVPGPLPVLGASAAFAFSRKLRRRLAAGRHPSSG